MDTALLCFRNYHPQNMDGTFRILAGIALLLTTVISLALNFVLGYVLYSTSVLDGFFRWHVISFICSDLAYLLANCIVLVPTALFNLYIGDPLNAILTLPNGFGYYALLFTTTSIAADRFLFFFYRKVHFSVTSQRSASTWVLPAAPWISAAVLQCVLSIGGCRGRTDPFTLTFTYLCSDCGALETLTTYINFTLPAMTVALYCSIYSRVILMRKFYGASATESTVESRRSLKLVVQFSIICAIQLASSSLFTVLPPLMHGSDVSFFIPMLASTINTMTNPFVMFLFQPRLRLAFYFRRCTKQTATSSRDDVRLAIRSRAAMTPP